MGKLSGIKVIDLSVFLPGPMLTMMMADQGAEVIKIETAAGDPARDQAPFEEGQSVWFRNLNRGKKSVVLDLKSEGGKTRLWDLIADADVFVEGFRPGVMKRLGFDYAAVALHNPQVVYCSISAFGQTGELAHHPAHDMAVQAMAGFLSVNDGADGNDRRDADGDADKEEQQAPPRGTHLSQRHADDECHRCRCYGAKDHLGRSLYHRASQSWRVETEAAHCGARHAAGTILP